MSPTTSYRSATTFHVASMNAARLYAARSVRPHNGPSSQHRSLWWWSRHGCWSTSKDESLEDRMHKYQKVMRYRYSRALKRRAIWDRDNSPPLWALRRPGRWLSRAWGRQPISTTEQMQASLKDDGEGFPRHDKPWEEAQRDFESFKVAVDRAIAKDPVGFLFGRRLQGPLSSSNSSWTSFARMFDSKESQESFEGDQTSQRGAKRIKIEDLDKKKGTDTASSPTASKATKGAELPTQPSQAQSVLYVYDPISGRNIPKPDAASKSTNSEGSSFWGSLFSEHGPERTPPENRSKQHKTPSSPRKFESSRSYEYHRLRANAIGSNIDTTAEFGGKCREHSASVISEPPKHPQQPREVTDEDPPFAGTVFEHSHGQSSGANRRRSTWLENEGFQSHVSGDEASLPSKSTTFVNGKLKPSFDRMLAEPQTTAKKFTTKLQPAIDRIETSKSVMQSGYRPAPLNVATNSTTECKDKPRSVTSDLEADVREDLDLLRSSDVRAGTKSVRITKAETDQAKLAARKKLEADYNRQLVKEVAIENHASKPLSRLSQAIANTSLGSISKHVRKFPNGIVAKTVNSLGAYNENFKLYMQPGTAISGSGNKTGIDQAAQDKLLLKDNNSQSKKLTPVPAVSPENVKALEMEKQDITRALRETNAKRARDISEDHRRFTQLATQLRDVFESKKSDGGRRDETKDGVTTTASSSDMAPLKTATVKPGVERWFHIERYTQEFEPKIVTLRDQAKMVKKSLDEVKTDLQAMQSAQPRGNDAVVVILDEQRSINRLSATDQVTSGGTSRRQLTSDEKQQLDAMRALNDRIKKEPHLLEKPVLQPSRDIEEPSTLNHRSAEQILDHNDTQIEPAAPFVILTYNKKSAEVDTTQLDSLMGQDNAIMNRANPIVVMGNLNYPAAFVTHFVALEKAGYSLVSGGGDILIFQKANNRTEQDEATTDTLHTIKAIKVDISELRNKIAEEEAKSQPRDQPTSAVKTEGSIDTSAVNIASEPTSQVEPAAPVDLPSSSTLNTNGNQKKKDRKLHKVRRQERVFSGTIRPGTSSTPSTDSTPSNQDTDQSVSGSPSAQPGVLTRFLQSLRKMFFVTIGLGVTAYTIGVISEGMGAHAQVTRTVLDDGDGTGPRKRMVMPVGQRPGIYSTESSRDA